MNSLLGVFVYVLALSLILLFSKEKLAINKFLRIFYVALIRTKIGLSFMQKFAKRFSKVLSSLSYVSIFLGFAGMLFVSFDVLKGFYSIVSKSSTSTVGLVLPFDVKGAFYVPFAYWLISIIVVMLVHELSHGIFARLNKIRVKSSGFAVFGAVIPLIPGAFVDVDEKAMAQKSLFVQLSVLSAGTFANIVFGALFVVLMLASSFFVNEFYHPSGVLITGVADNSPAKITGLAVGEVISNIDGKVVKNIDEFTKAFDNKQPDSFISINQKRARLKSNPSAESTSYLGVFVEQNFALKNKYSDYALFASILAWLKELFFWLFAINLGVGIFNLLPLGFLDGGRMFGLVACRLLKHKHANRVVAGVNTAFLLVLLASIGSSFVGAYL